MATLTLKEYSEIKARMNARKAAKDWLTPEVIAKRSKYGNIKTNGYDSKKEYHRSVILNAMADSGQIQNLRKQVKFVLQDKFEDNYGIRHRAITYTPDFVYERNGRVIAEDVKSIVTLKKETYRIKRKLFAKLFPDIQLIET